MALVKQSPIMEPKEQGWPLLATKADKKMSESGQMALRLFRKFMDGKIYSLKASF